MVLRCGTAAPKNNKTETSSLPNPPQIRKASSHYYVKYRKAAGDRAEAVGDELKQREVVKIETTIEGSAS